MLYQYLTATGIGCVWLKLFFHMQMSYQYALTTRYQYTLTIHNQYAFYHTLQIH